MKNLESLIRRCQFRDITYAGMMLLGWIITSFDLRLNDNSLLI